MMLTLGVLSLEDCELVRGWRNRVPHVLRTPFLLTREMQANFYESVVSNRNSHHRYYGLYQVNQEGCHLACVGMGGLTSIAWEAGTAEISLIIAPHLRGKGVGRQAVHLLLTEGFHTMRLAHVYGEVYGSNDSGMSFWSRLAQEWGATTATLPARSFRNGRHWDSLYFDFASLPAQPETLVPSPPEQWAV